MFSQSLTLESARATAAQRIAMAAGSSSMVSGALLHISLLIYLQVNVHPHYIQDTPLTATGRTRLAWEMPPVLLLVSKEENPALFPLAIIHSIMESK
jgi:hypothetical protein